MLASFSKTEQQSSVWRRTRTKKLPIDHEKIKAPSCIAPKTQRMCEGHRGNAQSDGAAARSHGDIVQLHRQEVPQSFGELRLRMSIADEQIAVKSNERTQTALSRVSHVWTDNDFA